MELISKQAVLEILDEYAEDVENGNPGMAYQRARNSVNGLHPYNRKHGMWTVDDDFMQCSICDSKVTKAINKYCVPIYNYCPMCGARM